VNLTHLIQHTRKNAANKLPQTLTLPKPLVEFGNKPMILHQVESLAAAGVTDIVLAVNYRPEIMTAALKKVCLALIFHHS